MSFHLREVGNHRCSCQGTGSRGKTLKRKEAQGSIPAGRCGASDMDTGTGLPHWSKASRSSLLVERTPQGVANEGEVNGEGARDRGDAGPAGAAGKAPQGGASERKEEPRSERLSLDRKELFGDRQKPDEPHGWRQGETNLPASRRGNRRSREERQGRSERGGGPFSPDETRECLGRRKDASFEESTGGGDGNWEPQERKTRRGFGPGRV